MLANLKSVSLVVTMFSMAELSRASRRGMELISTSWLGMGRAASFRPASARLAATHLRSTGTVSSTSRGGIGGRALYGLAGSNRPDVGNFEAFLTIFAAYGHAAD